MTPKLPPRRLLAVAAALALIGGYADASSQSHPKTSLDGSEQVCPLGSFHCPVRPYSFAMCRPNSLLEFYDPILSKDNTVRDTSPTFARAQHVESTDQTVYHLSGNVNLQRADQELRSDTADYNDDTSDYDARGHVRYQDSESLLASGHMRGNNDASRGVADEDLRYQMLKTHGNGIAQRGEMFDADHRLYSIATYSTCDLGHHIWEIHAKSIFQDYVNERGVARNATIRVYNVPILYLPYFSFPLDNERQTGFLTPMFNNTSRAGFRVMAPYYLNLAPNYDATLTPSLYTSRGPMLGGEFRYLFPGYTGLLQFEYLPSDLANDPGTAAQTKGDDRYLIKYVSSSHLWDSWSLNTNINHASDRNYLYDFGSLLDNSAIGTLTSSVYVNGGSTWWNASLGGDIYQNVNPFLPDTVNPYNRLPRATLNLNIPLNRWLEFGMNNEAVAFSKNQYAFIEEDDVTTHQRDFVEGDRLDLYPYLAADFQGSYWFVKPELAYRYTAYQLDSNYGNYGYSGYGIGGSGLLAPGQTSPFTQQDPTRSLPIASIDSGLIFDRSISLFGDSYTQTLEPRMYYLYVPYRNQNDLPLFDTSLMTFDYWQLFSPNQFSGADRQMNANDLTGAITTRLLDDDGVERFSASFGQIRYFAPQRVQLPTGPNTVANVTDWSGSDYVAQVDVQLNDQWRLNSSYQWNPNTQSTDIASLEIQRRIGTDGILNFSYHYLKGLLEQYSVSAVYPLTERWRLVGAWTYSILNRETVEALAGVEYDNCCVTLRLVDRNYVNQAYYGLPLLPTTSNLNYRDNAVMFEVVFKGLGSSGGQIDTVLRRDILGYQ